MAGRIVLGIFVSLCVLGYLAYRGTLLPGLFKHAASPPEVAVAPDSAPAAIPAPAATPAPSATPAPAAIPAPQPGCRLGTGACDWAGRQSPHPSCYHGVGSCDWGGLQSPPPPADDGVAGRDSAALQPPAQQPGCHHGAGSCDWSGLSSPTPRGSESGGARKSAALQSPQPQPRCRYGIGSCDWTRTPAVPAAGDCEDCGGPDPASESWNIARATRPTFRGPRDIGGHAFARTSGDHGSSRIFEGRLLSVSLDPERSATNRASPAADPARPRWSSVAAFAAAFAAPLRLEISTALRPEISWPASSGICQKK